MAFEFKLPDIGEGVVEGELVKWLVNQGDEVQEDTPLFEVLTDKVSAVIPSPRAGTVSKTMFEEGDIVPVGAVVLTIDEAAGASAPKAQAPAKTSAAAPAAPAPAQSADVFEFKLPDIGEGVVEGELVKWLVQDGESVVEDTPLFEVLTDKVSAVIPSPKAGTVAKRMFAEGDIVPVGAVVVTIAGSGGGASTDTPAPSAAAPVTAAKAPAPAPTPAAAPAATPARKSAGGRVRATPATRKLARTMGVDITEIPGTGDHGRVTKQDVQTWAARGQQGSSQAAPRAPVQQAPVAAPSQDDEVRKIIGLRRRISDNMRMSRDKNAHFTYVDEIDFTEVSKLKNQLRSAGVKTTFLPFVMKAVITALKDPEFEHLNAWTDYEAGTITIKRSYHLGIAAATDAGLLVPVIFDADKKSVRTLVDELGQLGQAAREGQLPVSQLSGSTFTITSLGKLGGMFATPIINTPETAILGLHKIEKRPVVVDDQIVIRERMYMSCSFDHRMIDGHVGAAFIQRVKALLEQPALLMAEL
ncbi:MAG TPA: pyruvate dehydrogenase [Myxococcales bacterium]|nr:pyruvate dehydrogenase [Myxococcales bacterium]HAN32871.1 pyruvate dehydrogenase [Myxococcales bacterium]